MHAADKPSYFGKDLEAMSFAENYHKWILEYFAPYLGRDVAEIGAGVGDFSKLLLSKTISRLTAFEPSSNMFPRLKAALEADLRATTCYGYLGVKGASGPFDSVVYVNVLEHIEDDVAELRRAYACLRSQGHLLVFVPALQWLYSELDRQVGHFRRYTKKQLVELVQGASFEVVRARYFDVAGILPWYVNFVLLKNSMGSGSVRVYDRLVVPMMRVLEAHIPPPIGKNVLLIAVKR